VAVVAAGREHDLLDVVAGAERGVGPGDDEAAGVGGGDRVGQLGVGGVGERVAGVRPVERDDADVAVDGVADLGVAPRVGHGASPPSTSSWTSSWHPNLAFVR
jgi:hypothetical protein